MSVSDGQEKNVCDCASLANCCWTMIYGEVLIMGALAPGSEVVFTGPLPLYQALTTCSRANATVDLHWHRLDFTARLRFTDLRYASFAMLVASLRRVSQDITSSHENSIPAAGGCLPTCV
jgi:hypothetical protein